MIGVSLGLDPGVGGNGFMSKALDVDGRFVWILASNESDPVIIDARFKSDLPSLDPISFIFDVGIKDDVDITDDPDPRLVLIKNSDKIKRIKRYLPWFDIWNMKDSWQSVHLCILCSFIFIVTVVTNVGSC